jgi:hypothetical protein
MRQRAFVWAQVILTLSLKLSSEAGLNSLLISHTCKRATPQAVLSPSRILLLA